MVVVYQGGIGNGLGTVLSLTLYIGLPCTRPASVPRPGSVPGSWLGRALYWVLARPLCLARPVSVSGWVWLVSVREVSGRLSRLSGSQWYPARTPAS